MFKELCPLDRLVHDLAGFLNDVMHLEHVFRDVYADCCTIHDWILRLPWGNFLFSTWAHRCRWPVRIHLDLLTRSRVGRVHFIPRVPAFRRGAIVAHAERGRESGLGAWLTALSLEETMIGRPPARLRSDVRGRLSRKFAADFFGRVGDHRQR